MASERSAVEIAFDLTKLIVEAGKGSAVALKTSEQILEVCSQCFKKVIE
jgi:hypothetical protein